MPRKSPASRTHFRRIGLLSLLLTTLLAPAGIVVGTVTAAALIGGAFHLSRAEPETPVTPPVSIKTGNPQHLDIERDGKTLALVIAEDPPGQGSGADSFDPANPLFDGLAGNGPTQPSTPAGMPSGRSPGGSLPGGGFGPASGGPEKPGETPNFPPPPVKPQPNPEKEPPEKGNGLPPATLPGLPTLPLADTPQDTQTPPPSKDLATQPNAVPEPSMLGLMLLGVAALAWSVRRRPDSLSPA